MKLTGKNVCFKLVCRIVPFSIVYHVLNHLRTRMLKHPFPLPRLLRTSSCSSSIHDVWNQYIYISLHCQTWLEEKEKTPQEMRTQILQELQGKVVEILDDPPSSSPALRAVRILDILITLQGLRSIAEAMLWAVMTSRQSLLCTPQPQSMFSPHDSYMLTTIGWPSPSGFQNCEKLCHHPRAEISWGLHRVAAISIVHWAGSNVTYVTIFLFESGHARK